MSTPSASVDPHSLLAGRVIAITRPRAQAEALATAIQSVGGTPLLCPLLEISAASDPAPLTEAAARLSSFALAVFVSANAVRHALPVLLRNAPWPQGVLPVAVGEGTAAALVQAGGPTPLVPSGGYDSEALLALPELSASRVAGREVALFRGDGGRELLADSLQRRGAHVVPIPCYRRRGPAARTVTRLKTALAAGELDAITLSSSEALRHLLTRLADDDLLSALLAMPLFAPHPRIAGLAVAAGFIHVETTPPGDAGLLAGLCAYNWPQP